ncbi:hypothetical protein ScPMuIL_011073 [Solemya velum]
MGFSLQLRLLLWKNITLKKRSPFVLLFEVCIPLVLFVILLLIRKGQPSIPIRAGGFDAQPLPSSGVIPIMQSFCDHKDRDEHDFMVFKGSSANVLLEKLQTVGENHKFFHAGYAPNEMDTLPDMYKRIIDDPASLHDQFLSAEDFPLSSIVRNVTVLTSFLHNNLSLPTQDINTLLSSSVHVHEVYRLLFGENLDNQEMIFRRVRRFVEDELFPSGTKFSDPPKEMEPPSMFLELFPILQSLLFSNNESNFSQGIIPGLVFDQDTGGNREVVDTLLHFWGIDSNLHQPLIITSQQTAQLLKSVLLSPTVIRWVACNDDELTKLLIPSAGQNASGLLDITQEICNISTIQMTGLSELLKESISDQFIIQKDVKQEQGIGIS